MSNLNCPYCDAENDVCHDDGFGYEEGVNHEMQCHDCGKFFVFQTSIDFYYEPATADCLNDAEHNLKFRKSFPEEYSRMCCTDCDFERRATPAEIAKNIGRIEHEQR